MKTTEHKSSLKWLNITLWVFLIALLGLSGFLNLTSVLFYSKTFSLFILVCSIVIIAVKSIVKIRILKKEGATHRKTLFVEIILSCLFCLLFFSNAIIPKYRIKQIAQKAHLDLPSFITVHYFEESIHWVGSEDSYYITISFPKKHIMSFTKPFWPEGDRLTQVVPDNEREGLPILTWRDELLPKIKLLEAWVDNPPPDPNQIIKVRDEVLGEGGRLPSSFEAFAYEKDNTFSLWQWLGRDGNVKHKHWAAGKQTGGDVDLFIDIEKEDTATAYMDIVLN